MYFLHWSRLPWHAKWQGHAARRAPEPRPLDVDDHVGRARPVVRQPLADRAQLLDVARVRACAATSFYVATVTTRHTSVLCCIAKHIHCSTTIPKSEDCSQAANFPAGPCDAVLARAPTGRRSLAARALRHWCAFAAGHGVCLDRATGQLQGMRHQSLQPASRHVRGVTCAHDDRRHGLKAVHVAHGRQRAHSVVHQGAYLHVHALRATGARLHVKSASLRAKMF